MNQVELLKIIEQSIGEALANNQREHRCYTVGARVFVSVKDNDGKTHYYHIRIEETTPTDQKPDSGKPETDMGGL